MTGPRGNGLARLGPDRAEQRFLEEERIRGWGGELSPTSDLMRVRMSQSWENSVPRLQQEEVLWVRVVHRGQGKVELLALYPW